MMDKTPKTLAIATMAISLLFLVQGITHIVPVPKLNGEFLKYDRPKCSWNTLSSGEYQRELDKYCSYHYGFSEWTIRMYCQYIWSVYHRSPVDQVAVGKHNFLFEPYFVEDFYESRMYKYTESPVEMRQMFEAQASRLAKLQAILQEAGVYTVVACVPGKSNIYPENVPPRDTLTRPAGPRAIEEYPPLFDRLGVNYVNLNQWFLDIKGKVDYDLFTPMGTHWSNVASTYAFDTLMRYINQLGGKPIRNVMLSNLHEESSPREPDCDLEKLMNLLWHIPTDNPYKYVDVSYAPLPAGGTKPKAIVVGDSFFWNITYNYQLDSLFDYCHYWFYNNSVYFDTSHSSTTEEGFDYVEQLLSADYLLLFYCTGQLYDIGVNTTDGGGNLLTKGLIQLCYNPDEIEGRLAQLCSRIYADEEWIGHLRRKSEKNGMPLDELVVNDAKYILYTKPEEFFAELAAPGVPAKRSDKYYLYRRHEK